LFLRKIYSLKSNKKTIAKLFDSGFWLGIFFILEPVFILLFILIYLSIYLHNKITIHTLFAPLMGFISPLIIFFAYSFWFDKTEEFTGLFYVDTCYTESYVKSKYIWVIGTTFFLTVFAIILKSSKALSVNNTFRKNWILLITNFFLLILLTVLIPQKNGIRTYLYPFPNSYYFSKRN
jgi:glucan phosphoethanolaminetransferase (alkaline phosphatase superfamily)